MAGWMKVEKATASKPEIAILARKLNVSIGEAFLSWFMLYSWADGMTADGFVRHLADTEADRIAGAIPGTCAALASEQIGWITIERGGLRFARWERHNGNSAKARALEAEAKRLRRENCPTNTGQICPSDVRPEERERREVPLAKNLTQRVVKGNTLASESEPATRRPSRRSQRSSRNGEEDSGKFVLPDDFDWDHVLDIAQSVAKRVPPLSDEDRRQWIRYAVLSLTTYSEAWIMIAADYAHSAVDPQASKQARFVGALKERAHDLDGISEEDFNATARRIEIPTKVWKSKVLPIK